MCIRARTELAAKVLCLGKLTQKSTHTHKYTYVTHVLCTHIHPYVHLHIRACILMCIYSRAELATTALLLDKLTAEDLGMRHR